ncbi:kinase-like domain-containing protein [Hypoxylon argillaceum]|nr:kinase-like domain-containing protein [Hypoxylon argillaceum]
MSPRYKLYAAIIPSLSKLPSVKHYSIPTMFLPSHACDVDASPLHRFTGTGLSQRYRVIQKIGWGGHSTTWVAHDQLHGRNVALKVSVSEKSNNGEAHISNAISKLSKQYHGQEHPGRHHLVQMLDHFSCIPDVIESLYSDGRLPADLAKSTAYQALLGIDFLSRHKIGHGDLHSRNIAFTLPTLTFLNESRFLEKFGRPETMPVRSLDGMALTAHVPNYIVRPISFNVQDIREGLRTSTAKIIDFGEAFFQSQNAAAVHTPLVVRAPEAIFDDCIDQRIDMWSMGCLLFELVAGQPPFDAVMLTRAILVSEMMEFCGDELPDRWREKLDAMGMGRTGSTSDTPCTLLDWLEDIYFDDNKVSEFTRQDIARVCELVTRMLKLEPSSRASAKEITDHPWFGGLKSYETI